jgi:hypothetical protein
LVTVEDYVHAVVGKQSPQLKLVSEFGDRVVHEGYAKAFQSLLAVPSVGQNLLLRDEDLALIIVAAAQPGRVQANNMNGDVDARPCPNIEGMTVTQRQ